MSICQNILDKKPLKDYLLVIISIWIGFSSTAQTASFSTNPVNINGVVTICQGQTINYINTSTGTQSNTNYNWTFNGGTPTNSNLIGPHLITYSTPGNYTTTLSLGLGITSSVNIVVTANTGQNASMSAGTLNSAVTTTTINGLTYFKYCSPQAPYTGSIPFAFNIPAYTPGSLITINWGDGSANTNITSSGAAINNLPHIYNGSVTNQFTLTITVTNPNNGCTSTQNYGVFLGLPPTINISGNTQNSCNPSDYDFTLTTNNVPNTLYQIIFNDGSPATTLLTPFSPSVSHNFNTTSCGTSAVISGVGGQTLTYPNAYAASVIANNVCGSTFSSIGPIYVSNSTEPNMSVQPQNIACVSQLVSVNDISIAGQNVSSVTCDSTYFMYWAISPNSGYTLSNGTSLGSNNGILQFPSFWTPGTDSLNILFNTPGQYSITLYTANTCGIDSIVKTICITSPVVADFLLPINSGCAPLTISPINNSPIPQCSLTNFYNWTITPSNPQGCTTGGGPAATPLVSILQSPSFNFTGPGIYTLQLVVGLNGAPGSGLCANNTLSKTITIQAPPMVSLPIPAPICEGSSFTPTSTSNICYSTPPLSFVWNFNPNNNIPIGSIPTPTNAITQNPGAITYLESGTFPYSLTATNSCGSTTATQNIVVQESVIVTPGTYTPTCMGSPIQLAGTITGGVITGTWSANIAGGSFSPNANALNAIYTPPATYVGTIILTLTSAIPQVPCPQVSATTPLSFQLQATANAGTFPNGSCMNDVLTLNGQIGGAASSSTWTSNSGGIFSNPTSLTSTYTPPAGFTGLITLTLTTNDPAGPCIPAVSTVILNVKPIPIATVTPLVSTICSGAQVVYSLSSTLANTNYSWAVVTPLPAGITAPLSGTVNSPANTFPVTIMNSSNATATISYTITPSLNGCFGTPVTAQITVQPVATVNTLTNIAVCSGAQINPAAFVSNPVGSTFTWTNSNPLIGLASNGIGSISPLQAPVNNTNSTISGNLIVTPTYNSCVGTPSNFTISVYPAPFVTNSTLTQALCSGASSAAVSWTSGVVGATFSWTAVGSSGSISGFPANGNGNLPVYANLINTSNTDQTITFTVIATANGCNSVPVSYVITVKPTPILTISPNQTICGGSTTSLTTFSNSVLGGTFTWVLLNPAVVPATITGFPTSGNGQIPASIINNGGVTPYTLNYTITPTSNGCQGTTLPFSITINPAPVTVFSQANQSLCTGGSSSLVTLSSATPAVTYSWTATVPGGIGNFSPTTGTNTIPVYSNLTNLGVTPLTISIVASATTSGNSQCPGAPANYTITVNPAPQATAVFNSNDTICNGAQLNISLSSTTPSTLFTWTVTNGSGVTGGANSVAPNTTIQQTLNNNSLVVGSVSYLVTPISSGCSGSPTLVTGYVNPIAIMTGLANIAACPSSQISPVSFTSNPAGSSFSWTNSNSLIGLSANGTGQILPWQAPVNNTNSALVGTISVTPIYNGCVGTAGAFTATIYPTPSVTNVVLAQTICSGASTAAVAWTSNIAGATFNWSAVGSSPSLSGFNSSGIGNLPVLSSLVNSSNVNQTVTFSVVASSIGCPSLPVNYVITVKPSPVLTLSTNQTICGGTQTTITGFSNSVAGGNFSWTLLNVGGIPSAVTGYPTSGIGQIPVSTINNTGNSDFTLSYTVTPNANSCSGTPLTFTITIHPTPLLTSALTATICSGSAVNQTLVSNIPSSYSWLATNNIFISGESLSNQSGNPISDVLANTSASIQTVNYTVILTTNANSCIGTAQTLVVTVAPPISMTSINAQTICSGTQTNIPLSANISSTYSWMASDNTNVSGESLTSQTGLSINNTLTNSSSVIELVTYTVLPTSIVGNCPGASQTVTISIVPAATMTNSVAQTICSGTAVNIALTPSINSSLSWVATNNTNVSGESLTPQVTTLLNNTLINPTAGIQLVTYTITPTTQIGTCIGTPQTVTISVIPAVNMTSANNQAICSGASINFSLSANVPSTFSWVGTDNPFITGESLLPQTSGTLNDILINTSNNIQTVTYTITPTSIGGLCVGNSQTFTLTVVPAVSMTNSNSQTICSGAPVSLSLTTNVPSPLTWSASDNPFINGESLTNQSSTTIGDVLINTSSTIQTVTYTVTPTSAIGNCAGSPQTITITINPSPVMTNINGLTICSGSPLSLALTSNVSANYSWSAAANNNVSGESTTAQSQNSITDILVNTTSTFQNVVYSVIPQSIIGSCNGASQQIIVVVNPIPTVLNPIDQVVCNNTATAAINISGAINNAVFTWSNSNTSINLSANGSGNIPSFTATNNTTNPITSTIIITPSYINAGTTCVGLNQDLTITVNPTPTVDAINNQANCVGTSSIPIVFSSSFAVSGTVFSWTNSNSGIGLPAQGTGNIPAFTTTNLTSSAITGTIIVAPVYSNGGTVCNGAAQTFLITVNPIPTVLNPVDQVICNNTPTNPIIFSGAVNGTLYSWTNTNTGINLGASGTGNILSFSGTNNTNTATLGLITVTPSYINAGITCVGSTQDVSIIVNPIPTVDAVTNQANCVGTITSAVTFTSSFGVPGTLYSWTNTNSAIGLGAASTGNIPSFTTTNATNAAISGTVTVTPSNLNAGLTCSGTPQSFNITVNPNPTVLNPVDQVVCNNSLTAAINFSGNVIGTLYSWTNSNTAINLAASGTGNISFFTGTNITTSPISGTITVTPSYSNAGATCVGSLQDVSIIVNPTPQVNDPIDQVICAGSQVAAVNFTGTGTSYNWTNTIPSIGLIGSGTGNIAGFTGINNGVNPLIAQISVTPQYLNANLTCSGTIETFSLTIDPLPTVQFSLPNQTICSASASSLVNITSSSPGVTISWSAPTIPSTISGLNLQNGGATIPSFNLTNSGLVPATIQFFGQAVTSSQALCSGPILVYTITVNPAPTVNNPSDQVKCNTSLTDLVTFVGSGTSYNWTNNTASIGLSTNGIGSIAPFSALNASSSPIIGTITVVPQYLFNSITCAGAAQDFTITVNPTPVVTAISDVTYCTGFLTSALVINGTGTSYTWNNSSTSIGLGASGINTVPAFTTTNNGASIITSLVTITPEYTNAGLSCFGPISDYEIKINPFATVLDPADQVVCNNSSTQAVNLTGTGTSYVWTNNNTIIGLGTNGIGNITAFNALNNTAAPIIAGVTVTAEYTAGGITCPGAQQNFTITVNPTPVVNVPINQVICNTASSTQVVLSGTGTSYSWNNSNTAIGLISSGTNIIPTFTGQNNGANPISGTITLIPSFLNFGVTCIGLSQQMTITVNPTPSVVDPQDLVVCNGAIVPATNFIGTSTSYNWVNNTPSIGLPSNGVGNILPFTAQNNTSFPIIATITATPDYSGGNANCTGAAQSFTITINPTPNVNDIPDQTICNTASTTPLIFTGTGTSYTWSNSTPSIGLSTNGIGDIPAFQGLNNGVNAVTGTITVTPQLLNASLTCSGLPQTIGITINPTPTVVDPLDVVICNGSASALINFSGTGTNYNWTNNNPSIGLGINGLGNITSFNAVNSGNAPITATITVTPSFTGNNSSCLGIPQTFTITVNPTPIVNASSNQIVCNGASTSLVNFSGTGTAYTWLNNTPSIGLFGNGIGDINSFTATNNTSGLISATVTVTPHYTSSGLTCYGAAQSFTISVNPSSIVTDPADFTVCNNSPTAPISFTGTGTYYNWTNNNPSVGLIASGTGDIPSFVAINNSNNNQITAQISVTAYFELGGVVCTGNTETFTITVNPTPIMNDPADEEVCNGSSSALVVFSGTATSYNWTNNNTLIGLGNNGTGNISPFAAINTTGNPIVSIVTVTPIYTNIGGVSCPGNPQTFTFTINPSPTINPIANSVICNSVPLDVLLSANMTSTFSWYATPNPDVTGEVSIPQSSTIINNTLTNNSAIMQYVTYHVVATSSPQGCVGPEVNFIVQVVPNVEYTGISTIEICSGGLVSVALQANVSSSYTWIATENLNVTGENTSPQTGGIITDQLINNSTQNQLVIYSVIPTSLVGNCVGLASTIAVIVRPPLQLINEDTVVICSETSPLLILEANTPSNFNWFADNNPNVQGESTSIQTTSIIGDVLINNTNVTQQVNYTVVASALANGCSSPVFSVTIFVNPLPVINNSPIEICTGEATNITLSASLPSIYTWSAAQNINVVGETFTFQNGSFINDVLINTSNVPQIVEYTITAKADITGCNGPSAIILVTVNPLPVLSFSTNPAVLCNITPVNFINTSLGANDYSWDFGDNSGSFLADPSHVYSQIGSYTVILTGTDQLTGCVNSVSNQVVLSESPEIGFNVSSPIGCEIMNVTFNDIINAPGTSLMWDFGDGESSFQSVNVDHQYPNSGCYDVTLTVTNLAGCSLTATQTDMVCVLENPIANFTALNDTMPTTNPIFEFQNYSINASTYLWLFDDGTTSVSTNPIHEYLGAPNDFVVTLYAYNEVGCYDTMMYTITVFEDLLFYVPNSFTPNNDGTNDEFNPVLTTGYEKGTYTLYIFNRWGEVIFESNNPAVGWDGSSLNGAPSQDGVYTWKITFGILQTEEEKIYHGHVTLIR